MSPELGEGLFSGETWEDAKAWLEANHVESVAVGVCDTYGSLRGKLLSVEAFLHHRDGMAMCDVFWVQNATEETLVEPPSGYDGYFPRRTTGYPDILIKPDLTTLRLVPWLEHTALVVGDGLLPSGEPLPIGPRQILKRVLREVKALGYDPRIGMEYEFYLVRETSQSLADKRYVDIQPYTVRPFTYSVYRSVLDEQFFAPLRDAMRQFGISIEATGTETGPGQFELNLPPLEALQAADAACLYKAGVKQFAAQRGLMATFMAKPQSLWAGNSCHLHQSLWKDDRNVFFDPQAKDQISKTMRQYTAGQVESLLELSALFAPTPNSYKRYVAYSWAATTASWGIDNRTTGLRAVVEGQRATRLENRMPGGDANPYLIVAAALAGGMEGIRRDLMPGDAFRGDAYEAPTDLLRQLPTDLDSAVDRLESSEIARKQLGEDFVAYYAAVKRAEAQSFSRAVTDWEVRHYMEVL